MAQTDPHGWTLTLISVSVVFAALIVLYFVYSFSGGIFSGEIKATAKKAKRAAVKGAKAAKNVIPGVRSVMPGSTHAIPGSDRESPEVAAAIALALDMEKSSDVYAAISTAVHLYLSDTVHDIEPGVITIVHRPSAWENKAMNFRQLPR